MSKPDWAAIAREYRAGQLSIRALAEKYGISDTAIRKRQKRRIGQSLRRFAKLVRKPGMRTREPNHQKAPAKMETNCRRHRDRKLNFSSIRRITGFLSSRRYSFIGFCSRKAASTHTGKPGTNAGQQHLPGCQPYIGILTFSGQSGTARSANKNAMAPSWTKSFISWFLSPVRIRMTSFNIAG